MPIQTSIAKKTTTSKNKKIALLALCVLVFLLIPATVLAYVGFVPVATNLMGTNKPVDLGVKYSETDFEQFQKNTQSTVSNFDGTPTTSKDTSHVASGTQLVLYGANSIQTNVTQEQLTAFLNMTPWKESPLSNTQVRFTDGTVEFSGNMKSDYVSALIHSLFPQGTNENLSPFIKLAGALYNPAVYAKFKISSVNTSSGPSHGQLSFEMIALKVNRMDLTNHLANANILHATIGEGSIPQGIPYSLSSLTVSNGNLDMYGTLPSNYSVGSGNPAAICNGFHGGSLLSLNSFHGKIGTTLKYCQ